MMKTPCTACHNRGFSLVELSIVLVILGLLTGGILSGQSLIRAAELRAVATEYSNYVTSLQTFRDKYMTFPGDSNKLTAFWGYTGGAGCTNSSGTAATTPGTCDGNGNGQLDNAGAASQSAEIFQFWRQLALAGLIEGTYTGTAGASGVIHTIAGGNAPRSKLNNAIWSIGYVGNYAGDSDNYAFNYGNRFMFGADVTGSSPYAAALKPEEAWNIDTKMDDGRPGYGKIIARYWDNACATGGATAADRANSTYNLANSTIQCTFYIVTQF